MVKAHLPLSYDPLIFFPKFLLFVLYLKSL